MNKIEIVLTVHWAMREGTTIVNKRCTKSMARATLNNKSTLYKT